MPARSISQRGQGQKNVDSTLSLGTRALFLRLEMSFDDYGAFVKMVSNDHGGCGARNPDCVRPRSRNGWRVARLKLDEPLASSIQAAPAAPQLRAR